MKEIIVSIPEELKAEIDRIKQENDIAMSYTEFYQYLLKLGLQDVGKSVTKE